MRCRFLGCFAGSGVALPGAAHKRVPWLAQRARLVVAALVCASGARVCARASWPSAAPPRLRPDPLRPPSRPVTRRLGSGAPSATTPGCRLGKPPWTTGVGVGRPAATAVCSRVSVGGGSASPSAVSPSVGPRFRFPCLLRHPHASAFGFWPSRGQAPAVPPSGFPAFGRAPHVCPRVSSVLGRPHAPRVCPHTFPPSSATPPASALTFPPSSATPPASALTFPPVLGHAPCVCPHVSLRPPATPPASALTFPPPSVTPPASAL